MNKFNGVEQVTADLSERAKAIIADGHSEINIMQSAFADFKALGSFSGLMSIMSSGKLNPQQLEVARRIAVKIITVLGLNEKEKAP